MKKLVPVLIFGVILLVVAKDRIPGLVTKAKSAAESYVGWTDEARKDDPVGYIEYAEEQLQANLEAFKSARGKFRESKAQANAELKKFTTLHLAAIELSEQARDRFQAAEKATDGTGYPVLLQGEEYGRDDLIAQVKKILTQRDTYSGAVDKFQGIIANVEKEDDQLDERIFQIETKLQELEINKKVVEIQKVTAEVDELFAKVDALLGENQETLEQIDGPVRSVEELLRDAAEESAPDASQKANEDVLNFLET